MILGFSTQINKKPTYFVEKILIGIDKHLGTCHTEPFLKAYKEKLKSKPPVNYNGKIHTIREDAKDRWKPGTKIDFFINCRQKTMFRFAPVLPVVSVQKIEIVWIGFSDIFRPWVKVDGKNICTVDDMHNENMLQLAQNDGFNSIEDFFTYFNKDFTGKLIHWTDLKY